MTATAGPARTILHGSRAPRAAVVATVLLLGVALALTGPVVWQVQHGAGILAFCGWATLTRLRTPEVGLLLGAVLLGAVALDPTPGAQVLWVAATTVLWCSVRSWWAALLVAVSAAALIMGREHSAGLAEPAEPADPAALAELAGSSARPLVVGLVLVLGLVLLDRAATTASDLLDTGAALTSERIDEDRAQVGDGVGLLIGRTLVAAREDIHAANAVADPTDTPAAEHLAALAGLVDHGIDQLGRLAIEPVAESLEVELRGAREVCERLGIAVTISTDEVADRAIADTAALVLREAVTNVLKHAEATRCVIVVRSSPDGTILAVTNDGVGPATSSLADPGSGQRRWRRELEQIGAQLVAGPIDDHRYRVTVRFGDRPAPRPAAIVRAGSNAGHDPVLREEPQWVSDC